MEQLLKMPKQRGPKKQPMLGRRPVYRSPPMSGTLIDPSQKKKKPIPSTRSEALHSTPSLGNVIDPGMYHGPKPAFHQTGIDLRSLLRSRHTKETIHRGKHGSDMRHAANLFDHAHHAGGLGAVRGGLNVGHGNLNVNQKFTYKNHMGTQVKVPEGWKVDNFGGAYDPTKPHPM